MRDERHRERALWRSRRGMLELDLLLVAFARRGYSALTAADQDAYQRLLDCDDWLVWDWLQRESPPPQPLARIVELVVAFNDAATRP